MKSKVTKLYAYRSASLPAELGRWRIAEEEIQERLATLAASNSREEKADTVAAGDGVCCVCRGDVSLPNRGHVLLFPGRGLPGAKEAEEKAVGKKVGEQLETTIGSRALTLEIQEIRRRYPAAIDDALVCKAGIAGVHTLKEYAAWYRGEHEPERRRKAVGNIVRYWMELMGKNSVFAIDEEEQAAWAHETAKGMYAHMLAVGEDPHVPEEGVEFLTKEQAIARIAKRYLPYYQNGVLVRAIAESRGVHLDEDHIARRYAQIAEFRGVPLAQAKADVSEETLLDTDYANKVYELLSAEAEPLLEV